MSIINDIVKKGNELLAEIDSNKDKKGLEVKIELHEDEAYFTIIIYDYDIEKRFNIANVHTFVGTDFFKSLSDPKIDVFIKILEANLNGLLKHYRQNLLNFLTNQLTETKENG